MRKIVARILLIILAVMYIWAWWIAIEAHIEVSKLWEVHALRRTASVIGFTAEVSVATAAVFVKPHERRFR